ncbi:MULTISPECIES: hypothetical protein [Arthrobacter]|uniref:DUF5709 domain-containing protein n=1 Tax=Arthrobacter terricola TaxID=2547396 RepID=A0A4R5KN57_9MICC|nr:MULTISPECIES: hypothetical protein [Arthrobacter]MBT8161329.1 hypothetical protein [Arthrobacter sp. GN70]TDF96077.1 hypothetical protein E1809_10945 [Arthrobacter terricola]
MTENTGDDKPIEEANDGTLEEPDLRGRYVEGDYGKTGREPGRHPDDEEGQYGEGDYGAAGNVGGLPEPLGNQAKESGRYARADLGVAGSLPGRTAGSEIGQYAEGDYGSDGTVGPLRTATAEQPAGGTADRAEARASEERDEPDDA